MADHSPAVEQARAALAETLARHVPDADAQRAISRGVAAYVAAVVRQERATMAVAAKLADLHASIRRAAGLDVDARAS